MLKAVCKHGFAWVSNLPGNIDFGFEELEIRCLVKNSRDNKSAYSLLGIDSEKLPSDQEILSALISKRVQEVSFFYKELS